MITAIPKPVNARVVQQLEMMLERARAGEIVGMVVTCELTEHRVATWGDFKDGMTTLGHLARQAALVNRALDEGAER